MDACFVTDVLGDTEILRNACTDYGFVIPTIDERINTERDNNGPRSLLYQLAQEDSMDKYRVISVLDELSELIRATSAGTVRCNPLSWWKKTKKCFLHSLNSLEMCLQLKQLLYRPIACSLNVVI